MLSSGSQEPNPVFPLGAMLSIHSFCVCSNLLNTTMTNKNLQYLDFLSTDVLDLGPKYF